MTQSSLDPNSVFARALEIEDEGRRQDFLQHACGSDASLRAEIEEMLRVRSQADGFMHNPGAFAPTQQAATKINEKPGGFIGPYKLLQQIGEGGMGVVFMAEQERPVRRKVALKIIKPGMDSGQVIARFEAERQALAMMDHTNIAKVLDAGTTNSGLPYFVMELVHGVPITEYCDANHLTHRERLELFIPVCHAIQHAHQKGIIHRDVKPSNILVTLYDDKPVPKVIDFGVAKAVEQRLTEKTLFTQYGVLVGTFEYMSPEQAELNAFGVDTRSDIYSLGVLLYELLTGTTPLEKARLRQAAFDELIRIIKEEEPPRPSARISTSGAIAKLAVARRTDAAKLSAQIKGELDWIVMKCLEKDRSRRYETANGLSRDIERYLRDETVEACPPSAWYKLHKAARKYRRLCLTASAFVLLLIGGAALASWLAVRAMIAEKMAQRAQVAAEEAKSRADSFTQRLREATQRADEGIEHFNRGNWAAAHASFEQAQASEVELWSIYAHRAALYLRLGLWEEAKQDYDARRRIAAHSDARTLYEHAVLQLATGDKTGYLQTCQELWRQADNWDANYYLIRACVLSRDSGVDATEIARRAEDRLTAQFSGFNAHLAGRAHLRALDLSQAQQRLEAGQKNSVSTAGGVHRIGNAFVAMYLHDQGKTTDVQAELSRTEGAVEEWTKQMLVSGSLPIAWWDWLEALIVVREVRSLVSGSPPTEDKRLETLRQRSLAAIHRGGAQSLMAQVRECLQRRDWDGAAATCSRVLDNMPLAFRYSSQENRYCLEMVEPPEVFERLAALRPNDSRLWHARGRWHANQRKWSQAAADYQQALRCESELVASTDTKGAIGPRRGYAATIHDLAAMLLLARNSSGYQKLCASSLELQGEFDDPFAFCSLARTCSLGQSGISDSSAPVRWGQIAAEAEPSNAWYVFSLGIAHFRAGDFEAAERTCENSLKVHPTWLGRGQNYAVLAMVCQRLGQTDRAREWLAKAQDSLTMLEKSRDEWKHGMAASDYLSDWLGLLILLPEAESQVLERASGPDSKGKSSRQAR